MLVQLSIKKLFLIFSALCSVESKGGRISCAVKVLSECAESEIRHNKHMAMSHSVSMLVTPKSVAFQVIFEKLNKYIHMNIFKKQNKTKQMRQSV